MAADVRLPAFTRLDATAGWRLSSASANVRTSPATGAVELAYLGTHPSPLTDPSGSFGGLTTPTGVAVGSGGVVLVASPDGREILRAPDPAGCHPALARPVGAGAGGFAPLWPSRRAEPPVEPDGCGLGAPPARAGVHELVRPCSLAFAGGDLVVVDEGDATTPARLMVYAWPSLVARHVAHIGGRPGDVAVDGEGRILVADAEAGRVRRFTPTWQEDAWPGGAGVLHRPRHLVIDGAGTVYVVDVDPGSGQPRLSRLTRHGGVEVLDPDAQGPLWHGRYPPPIQERDGALFAPGEPCVGHGPRLRDVVVDRRGRLPQGPVLVHRPPPGRRARTGTFVTEALDSGAFAFAWHRLVLEADLGEAGALSVETFTSAQPLEPERILQLPEARWSRRTVLIPGAPPEALVQSAPGRYLWLRIGFVGDGVGTPQLHGIDVLGPRRSSLRFLPAPFHEDPVSRDFLDRFLSYFDTIFDEVKHRIGRFPAQLSPAGAPDGDFLSWLVSWFDIELLAEWPDDTRRDVLAQAMDLHRTRGTIAGLAAVLRLHLRVAPPMPVLLEGFRLRAVAASGDGRGGPGPPSGVRIGGVPLAPAPGAGDLTHRFYVVVPHVVAADDDARATLRRLVDAFRPAHTTWALITVKPGVRIGCQSTIGVDTLVGEPSSAPLGEMALGQSAQLVTEHRHATRIGAARLGTSSVR